MSGHGGNERRQEPVILGVCARASDRIGWNVWAVRGMWLLAAIVLSPVVAGLFYIFTWFVTKEE